MAISSPINSSSFSLGSFFSFLSSSSAKQQGRIHAEQLSRLTSIRNNLEKIFKVYEKQYNAIIDSERKSRTQEERKAGQAEEAESERKKIEPKVIKDKVISKAKDIFGSIFGFFANIIKYIILYKVLDWISKPENAKKAAAILKFFVGIIKFFAGIIGFGVDRILGGLDKLVNGGGVTRFFGLLEGILGIFTILPFVGGMSIVVGAIKMIPRLFSGLTKFFTNLLPNVLGQGAKEALDDGAKAAKGAAKEAGEEATKKTAEKAATTATTKGTAEVGETAAKAGAKGVAEGVGKGAAKGGAKVAGKSLLKKIPVIGAIAGGIFAADRASKGDWLGAAGELASGAAGFIPGVGTAVSLGIDAALVGRDIANANKKDENLPKLAKGGVVTKPTKAIVGEKGPEAIIPLSKLGSSSIGVDTKELQKNVNRIVPQFIKLLLLPFTVIGAGVISLIGNIAGKFPIIGPMVMSSIGMLATAFGIPKSLVNVALKNIGKVDLSGLGGLGDLASLFGKAPTIKERKKGDKKEGKEGFKKSNDDSVRGLLGDILNALIFKNTEADSGGTQEPTQTPSTPSTPSDESKPSVDANTGAQLTPQGSTVSAADFGKNQLGSTKPKFGEGRSSGILQDVGNKNLQKVTGTNPGKYFYDAYGNVYAVDKDEKRILTSADFKAGVDGALGALYFFRNLNNGTVSISRHEDAKEEGWYDYAANAIREMKKGDGSRSNPDRITWVPTSESTKYKSGFSEATPYGKTTLKAKNGTYIPGNTNIDGDRVHVLAEPGEYMLNKNAVAAVGGPKELDKLNFKQFPRFAQWGGNVLRMATGGTVIEYITGDKSHPAYAADHGGGNYHDHLAFKSRAERDAAIKYLEGKGWYVGSRNDGRHATNSYHYSNQAFDIPFYPNQSRKGVTDNQSGETKLSTKLRDDLMAGGFNVPGGRGPGGPREEDGGKSGSPESNTEPQGSGVDWGNIAKQFSILSGALRGTPSTPTADKPLQNSTDTSATPVTPTATSARPSSTGTTLNRAQSTANQTARTQGGKTTTTVVNQPNSTVSTSTTTTGGQQFGTVHRSASPYITYPLSNT